MLKREIKTSYGFEYSHSVDTNSSEKLKIRHCHDSYEIILVASGNGRFIVEGAEFPLKPRTMALIRPFEYHCVEIKKNSVYERYVIHFPADCVVSEVREILNKMASEEGDESGKYLKPDAVPQGVVALFDKMDNADGIKDETNLYFKLLLSELIVLMASSQNQRIYHDEYELGARVAKYVNEYLDKTITLDMIARRHFVSKYYLCRAFKAYSGVPLHSYITHKRVIYAKQLIESGETASGAAYKVGFGDYSAFYRAYVKILGKPPTSK
jgi:AraC-like DNA-binding protein